MLSSTGNDVESGANGFRVSRGDSGLAENDGANPREESDNHDNQPVVRSSSSAVQRNSGKSTSQDRDDPLSPSAVHGSTPLSQIGAHGCAPVNDMFLGQGESNPRESLSRVALSIRSLVLRRSNIIALAETRSAESLYVLSFPFFFFFFFVSWDKSTFLDNLYPFYSEKFG